MTSKKPKARQNNTISAPCHATQRKRNTRSLPSRLVSSRLPPFHRLPPSILHSRRPNRHAPPRAASFSSEKTISKTPALHHLLAAPPPLPSAPTQFATSRSTTLRRAVRSLLPVHVASSQRRGFLTVVLQHGHHERAEYNLSVPWASAVASPSGAGDDAIAGVLQPWGGNNSDTPRLKLNSVEKGVVVASSELMTADEFESRSLRTRGRKRNLVDLRIWPQQSRAVATVMLNGMVRSLQ
jgi:hypothetical protein